MLEALKEKVRVLGEKMKGLKEKVKAAAGKAVDKLNKRAKEFFVSVGKKVKKVGKKAWAMRKEMSAVLILAICAPFGVVLYPFLLKYFVCGLGSESLDIFADAFKSTEFFLWTILVWRIMGFLSTLLSMSVSGAF